MPSPFPGMNPYLEHPALWPDVHERLSVALADHLATVLRPRYYVSVEERTYIVDALGDAAFTGRPDVAVVTRTPALDATAAPAGVAAIEPVTVQIPLPDEIRETYLEVRDPKTSEVITVIEILSLTNKRSGEGRRLYEEKRFRLLGTLTHLVEIDLLRGSAPMPMYGDGHQSDYRILISRSDLRPSARLYAFGVRDSIPIFRLPLRRGDDEPRVDLNTLLHALYDRAAYDLRINYAGESTPPLKESDASWAEALLRAAGWR